jgi:hypothetical protein
VWFHHSRFIGQRRHEPGQVRILRRCESCSELFKAGELAVDVDLASNLTPPTGSRITFAQGSGDSVSFEIPRAGFSRGDVFLVVFATMWTGCIAFWMVMAAGMVFGGGGIAGAFWVIAVGLWIGLINGVMESEIVELAPEELIIQKKRPFRPKRIAIAYDEIEKVSVDAVMPRSPLSTVRYMRHFHKMTWPFGGIPVVSVAHGTKKTHFAEQVSEAEMQWPAKVVAGIVPRISGKTVWQPSR